MAKCKPRHAKRYRGRSSSGGSRGQDGLTCFLLGKLQLLLELDGAHDLGGHGVAEAVFLAKALAAVRANDEVVLVVLAGVNQQGVALQAKFGAVLATTVALAAEVEAEAIIAVNTELKSGDARCLK